jgi:outer membrane protein, heavy metal efflux system
MVHSLLNAPQPMTAPRVVRAAIAMTLVVSFLTVSGRSVAEGVPRQVEIPEQLALAEALQILRTQGLDLLLAEAQVTNAEGDVGVAGAVPNPALSVGYGRILTYNPGDQCPTGVACDANQYTVQVADQAAIEDSLSGKRSLRLRVAHNALAAARLSRTDALRTLEFQVKSAYLLVAQAERSLTFARENQTTNIKTLQLFQARLRSGAINEGDVARIETQKLESDQAVDQSMENLRQARFALAFLLGARGPVPEFRVDGRVLDFAVPAPLTAVTADRMLRMAFERRPDLRAQGYQRASAEAGIALAKRQRFPDITLAVNYTQAGSGGAGTNAPPQPPELTVSVSAPIPIFYQQQGEIRKAEANYDTQSLLHAKTTAQVVNDVSSAVAAFETSRALVERMEGTLRPSAERGFQITRLQYDKGAATLMDFLDAQRTYIATNVEYLQDLTNYWTAVFQLEQAVGMELSR